MTKISKKGIICATIAAGILAGLIAIGPWVVREWRRLGRGV